MRTVIIPQADGTRIIKADLDINDANDAHRNKLFEKIGEITENAITRKIKINDALFLLEKLKIHYQSSLDELNIKPQFFNDEQKQEFLRDAYLQEDADFYMPKSEGVIYATYINRINESIDILKEKIEALPDATPQETPDAPKPAELQEIINNAIFALFPNYITLVRVKIEIRNIDSSKNEWGKVKDLIANNNYEEIRIKKSVRAVIRRISKLKATGEIGNIGDTYEFVKTHLKSKKGESVSRAVDTAKAYNKKNGITIL